MPELPDLQVFSKNLHRRLARKKLREIKLHKGLKGTASRSKLKKMLAGQQLTRVYREGKELRFAFGNKNVLGIHLMLRGKLNWFENMDLPKFTLAEFYFEGNRNLALTDYQRQARISLNPATPSSPDALDKPVNEKFWKEKLQTRATIKKLLTNQDIVRGIGSAYADEILWVAGISPFSISKNIPPVKIKALARAVKKVLTHAEKQIKKADPGIIGGEIRDFLKVHNPGAKKSPTGGVIKSKASGGSKTYYTSEQKLFA